MSQQIAMFSNDNTITSAHGLAEVKKRLSKYLFPVTERKVFFEDNGMNPLHSKDYKAIVRSDNGKLISIMNSTYRLEPNENVIVPVLQQLHEVDSKWYLDRSHSFIQDNRMRLQITFPDLKFNDGNSDTALSLFLHNSYDGSEGVRMFFGAIRAICTNGMVFGKVLAKIYARHTKNMSDRLENMKQILMDAYDTVPVIKERIEILKNLQTAELVEKKIKKEFGVKAYDYVKSDKQNLANQWLLLNALTYYISHYVKMHMRAQYQLKVSQLFEL